MCPGKYLVLKNTAKDVNWTQLLNLNLEIGRATVYVLMGPFWNWVMLEEEGAIL